MELDDLRRQWQQPEPVETPVAFDAHSLAQLLGQQSVGILGALRKNARWELLLNVAFVVVSLGAVAWAPLPQVRLLAGSLALVALVSIYYFYRKLLLLRGMDESDGDLRAHLVRVITGLRALMRFYYWFTLALVPVSMLGTVMLELFKPYDVGGMAVVPLVKLVRALSLCLVFGPCLWWLAGRVMRWYLQCLYGKHLDRLEANLCELGDEPTAV